MTSHDRTSKSEGHTPSSLDRKRFLDWLLGTTVAGFAATVVYPVTRYLVPPEGGETSAGSVTLPFDLDDIPPNSGQIFKFGNRPGILVHTPSGDIRAFSARCTHLDCTVQYREDLSHIWCACHDGHYDLTGSNIAGPPPSPLEQYEADVEGDEVVVSRKS